jgi:hypothetical protein
MPAPVIVTEQQDQDILSQQDRCDVCAAQAYVLVRGVSGELMFCGHDYEYIISSESGKEKMMGFAFEIIDERHKLEENRLVGEN